MGTVLGLLIVCGILGHLGLKIDVSLKVKANNDSDDHKSDD